MSLILPIPLLYLVSYLLRYRAAKPPKSRDGSTESTPTDRTLALMNESQLSLPVTISPKLTPAEKRVNASQPQVKQSIEPKPSISNFGFAKPQYEHRRHTVYGSTEMLNLADEEVMRRTLARRSGDVWIESGHAVEGGGLLSRATEMLKPIPAMRVLEANRNQDDILTRLRGGVVSMLLKRISYDNFRYPRTDEGVSKSPIRINITTPSKAERRSSQALSIGSEEQSPEPPLAEISIARMGRMSASPSFFYAESHSDDDTASKSQTGGTASGNR